MGIRPWLVAVFALGCGSVSAVKEDAPGGRDGPACMACVANGEVCDANSQCTSGTCACHDAACATKVCSASSCACEFTSAGTACDGELAAGTSDASCTTGCDGTGACATPLLWYKFDEAAGAGTVANSGTWPGTATVTGTQGATGVVGKALHLGAAADGVVIADPADNSLDGFTSVTIEAWINMSTLPLDGYATILKKDNAYICRLVEAIGSPNNYSNQAIAFPVGAAGPVTDSPMFTVAPTANAWHHVACAYGGSALKVYFDGTLMMSVAAGTAALANSTAALGIGQSSLDGENLVGLIDDFKLWTAVRTDRQICLDACGTYAGTTCTFDAVCGN